MKSGPPKDTIPKAVNSICVLKQFSFQHKGTYKAFQSEISWYFLPVAKYPDFCLTRRNFEQDHRSFLPGKDDY